MVFVFRRTATQTKKAFKQTQNAQVWTPLACVVAVNLSKG
jgi:hypothetical protein